MSKPREAWYSYTRNVTKRYPNNVHEVENEAVKKALTDADAVTLDLVQIIYLKKINNLPEAARRCFVSEATARRKTSRFFREVAKNLGLPTN